MGNRSYRVLCVSMVLGIAASLTQVHAASERTVHLIGCAARGESRRRTIDLRGLGTIEAGDIIPVPLNAALREDSVAIRSLYGVQAVVMLIDERDGPNAYAIREIAEDKLREWGGDPSDFPDGTVFLGTQLIRQEFADGFGNAASIPSILGHEFAHIMQYKRAFPYSHGKWAEIHADYMAGWFTAYRGVYRPQDARRSLKSFYDKGDRDFFDPDHHGTPEERADAFLAGYNVFMATRQPDSGAAYRSGLRYVRDHGAGREDDDRKSTDSDRDKDEPE